MDKFKANPEINVETILKYVSQKQIMEYYLGISVDAQRGMFCSPLRKDSNPTCTITWIDGKLLFRDWAKPNSLDCFGVVMERFNVNYYKAQEIVAKDFDLVRNIKEGNLEERDVKVNFNTGSTRRKSKIKVKIQNFTKENIRYLKSYSLTSELCDKFNVYCPKYVWVNGAIRYIQDDNNPALAYYFGLDEFDNQKWKIYFYKKKERRFLCNTNRINGWIQIPDRGKHLVITKSLKDVMCLDIFGIPAVAMQAETQTPYDYIIKELEDRFDKLISLYDHDEAGINRAEVLKQEYDIPYYFIEDDQAKDFSDYIQVYGKNEARKLIEEILCS